MTAASQSVIALYEQSGMTPDEIAEDQDLDVTAVKATLLQFSALYREQVKAKDDTDFTPEDARAIRDVILNIAKYSEDERVKLRAAIYVRDDTRGRLDVLKSMTGLNINVMMFNDQMKKAIAAKERARGSINISPVDKQLVEITNNE